MGKKQRDKKEPELPKFGGFKPLAGLKEFKDKLDEDTRAAEAERQKAAAAKGSKNQAPLPPRAGPPLPTRAAPARNREDASDELSFHRLMAGVTPLEERVSRVPVKNEVRSQTRSKAEAAQARANAETSEVLSHLHHLVDDAARFEVSDDGRHVEGRRTDVPPSVLRSLRRGLLPIDARLDLHGASAEAARERLLDFLRTTRTRGERCVLVIHGKGESVPGGGVLRGEIAAWLSQGRAREHVAAFATATQEDGGEGAVYVALRR